MSENTDANDVQSGQAPMTEESLFDSLYDELYVRLNALPEEERLQMLRELVPAPSLFSKVDGTLFRIRALGMTMFETKWMLENAGIQPGDPRAKVFKYLRGSFVDVDIPLELRAIAAKQATVARQTGAIAIQGDDKRSKEWWVPINATSRFTQDVQALIDEFNACVKGKLIDHYEEIHEEAHTKFIEAVEAAWADMERANKTSGTTHNDFLKANEQFFAAQFPSKAKVEADLKMEFFPTQSPLPKVVEQTVTELKNIMRQKAIADETRAQATAQAAQSQLRIVDIQRQMSEAALREQQTKEEKERQLRAELLKEKMGPELQRAHEIAVSMQTRFIKLAESVLTTIKSGKKVSSALRRSWRQQFEEMQGLLNGDTGAFQAALDALETVSETKHLNEVDLNQAQANVLSALQEIERTAAVSVQADALWKLIQQGKSKEVSLKLVEIRTKLNQNLVDLNTLEEMAARLGGTQAAIEEGLLDIERVAEQPEDEPLPIFDEDDA